MGVQYWLDKFIIWHKIFAINYKGGTQTKLSSDHTIDRMSYTGNVSKRNITFHDLQNRTVQF